MNNKKYNFFALVLNAKKESTNPREELMLAQRLIIEKIKSFTATIIHDKDILENGEIKRTHAHVFIETPDKRTCKQVLNEVQTLTKLNLEQIQIEGTFNAYLQIQYLIHKNDKNKHQYNDFEILTNNEDILNERLSKEYHTPDQLKQELLSDLKTTKSLIEFAEKHGIETANKYRNLFKDIKTEQHYDLKSVNEQIEFYENLFERLRKLIKEHKTHDGFIEVNLIENLFYSLDARKARF